MPALTLLLDGVAALREAMGTSIPDPVAAGVLADLAGVDGIGVSMREDHRHMQENDVRLLRQSVRTRLVLHMAVSSEMVGLALDIRPDRVVLMPPLPEDEADGAAEQGLDLLTQGRELFETLDTLRANGISVCVCLKAEAEQAKLAHQLRSDWVLIHAGRLKAAASPASQQFELNRIVDTVKLAHKLRMRIAVGCGLDYRLIKLFRGIGEIDEFSIGRSIVARALMKGLPEAIRDMRDLLRDL